MPLFKSNFEEVWFIQMQWLGILKRQSSIRYVVKKESDMGEKEQGRRKRRRRGGIGGRGGSRR